MENLDIIEPEQAGSLAGMFQERVRRTPEKVAYRHYDWARQAWIDTTWAEMAREAGRWQQAMRREGLQKGDRVAVMLRNSREWVLLDQAAAGLGFITVPLYVDDRPDNTAYILSETDARLLLVEGRRQWRGLLEVSDPLPSLERIVSVATIDADDMPDDDRLENLSDWLFGLEGEFYAEPQELDDLATIVYTSGTTGRPKGVMLSHGNMMRNARSAVASVDMHPNEEFLSFLPLSHMLERTVGCYLTMQCGFAVAFARSINQLADDLLAIRPTVLVSVPRIYERFYGKVQEQLQRASWLRRALLGLTLKVGRRRYIHENKLGRWSPLMLLWPLLRRLVANKIVGRLGGRLRLGVCGGAALQADVDRFFSYLGLPLFQGYGLTEASPVISVNRPGVNKIGSIGLPLDGIEVRLSDEGELQARSAGNMMGYWLSEDATRQMFTDDGWLRTGDLARIDEHGFLYIVGRSKEILVLSNGEKVPPADMEMAITLDPLFDQVMVIGEGRPALTAVIQVNRDVWTEIASEYNVDHDDESAFKRSDIKRRLLGRIAGMLKDFPGYAQIRNAHFTLRPWTVEEGILTPTLKLKRGKLADMYGEQIESLYNNQ